MKLAKGKVAAMLAATIVILSAIAFVLMRERPSGDAEPQPVQVGAEDFERGMAERHAAEREIVARGNEIVHRMNVISLAKNRDVKLLAEDPEWRELEANLAALRAEYEAARQETVNFRESHVVVGDGAKSGDISK